MSFVSFVVTVGCLSDSAATNGAGQTPTREKDRHARSKESGVGPERACRHHIHEQDPHPDDLSEPAEIIDSSSQWVLNKADAADNG